MHTPDDIGAVIAGVALLTLCLWLLWQDPHPRAESLAQEGRDFLRFDRDRDLR